MNDMKRLFRHLLFPDWWLRRRVGTETMSRIERAIADAEVGQGGEVSVVIETSLAPAPLLRGQSARARALEVFSEQRVWDTEANNGVLIYLLLADRDVEIVADRGIASQVGQAEWESICRQMESRFREGLYENGLLYGVNEVGWRLREAYPTPAGKHREDVNELPDRPVRL